VSDFKFELEDILDFDSEDPSLAPKTNEAVLREVTKEYAGPLATTRSTNNYANGIDTTLGMADILMSQVLFKNESTVMQRNEYMTSSLLGGSLTAEDNTTGSVGIFDNLVPNDIKSYVELKRQELGMTSGDAAGDASGATNGEYNTEQYTFYAEQLIASPGFRLQGRGDKNADYNRVLADLRDGLINPWLIAILKTLSDNFAIYVGNFDATKKSGHMSGSQHYLGNAVDIGDIGPKNSKWGEKKDPLSRDTALVQEVWACIDSIHAPWRPTVVIGPSNPSFGPSKATSRGNSGSYMVEGTSMSTNADHSGSNGHFHIDHKNRPKASEIPPVPSQTSSNSSAPRPTRHNDAQQ
jgi:hypothetical protein